MNSLSIKYLFIYSLLSITQALSSSSEKFDYYSDDDYDEQISPLKRSASLPLEELEEQPEEKKIKVDVNTDYVAGQFMDLMGIDQNILLLVIDQIDAMTDQVSFSLTCKKAYASVNSRPYAPKYLMPLFPRIVNPEIMHEVTVDDFINQLELDTVQGRKRFYETFTIEVFSKMLDGFEEGTYLLDNNYLFVLNAVRALVGIGFNIVCSNPHLFPERMFSHVSQILSLRKSRVLVLPRAIKNLTAVETFLCTDTLMRFLPGEICYLYTIKVLNLKGSNLMSIPKGFRNLSNLHKLNLHGALLKEIPEEVLELPNLKNLDMSNNWLTEVPFNINKLKKLEVLNLSNEQNFTYPICRSESEGKAVNALSELPLTFVELTNLQILKIENTGLVELPVGFNRLRNLTTLNISRNKFKTTPLPLLKMSSLITLDMSFNQLSELPKELAGLPTLLTLQIQGNNIASVPEEFKQNKQLQVLGAVWYLKQGSNN